MTTKMDSKNITDFFNLVKADTNTLIWCKTYEPDRFINDVLTTMRDTSDTKFDVNAVYTWDAASGLSIFNNVSRTFVSLSLVDSETYRKTMNPKGLLDYIAEQQTNHMTILPIFFLKNFHMFNRTSVAPNIVQGLLNLRQLDSSYQQRNPVIIVSPIVDIPEEEAKLFTVFDYNLPNESEVKAVVDNIVNQLKDKKDIVVSDTDIKSIMSSAKGLTYNEINNCIRKSIAIKKTLDPEFFKKEKIEIVKNSGCLDYKEANITIEDMGGNDEFKKWITEEKELFDPKAKEFGLDIPKGYICFGPPGSGKSASAEITANLLGIPLLELNFSKIMGGLVGQSERAIERALSIAKATAPCVLLLDECDKVLGGVKSSQESDSGTLARVLSRLLTFMQDNDSGVFIVMTSNDITKLPPELLRTGRFDTQWYFGLPDFSERKSILSLYLKKKNKTLSKQLVDYIVKKTNHFTGAELKSVVSIMLRKLYIRYKSDTTIDTSTFTKEDIDQAVLEIIPVYKYAYNTILELQQYAKTRARFASKSEELNHSIIDNLANNISL